MPGVRQVASEVQSPDTLADAEIWRKPTPPQPSVTDGVGAAARDLWITSATKMRLLADSRTPALDIHVDTTGDRSVQQGTAASTRGIAPHNPLW